MKAKVGDLVQVVASMDRLDFGKVNPRIYPGGVYEVTDDTYPCLELDGPGSCDESGTWVCREDVEVIEL